MPHVNDIGIFVNSDLTDDEKYSVSYCFMILLKKKKIFFHNYCNTYLDVN